MAEWSNEMCTTFMELYQMEPIIWNPKNSQHKDKNKVNDAWDRISKELHIGVQELKNKKNSLMATFRGHLRRKKASIKSGAGINDIYKPIWFLYELMESFLGGINECLPTINTERHENNSQAVEIQEESSTHEESPMPQSSIASTSQESLPPQHPRRRAKGSEYLINETSKQMKDTFNTLNSVLKGQRTEEDECDLYCKLLAKKLRRLPENERAIFMYEIDGMFINRLRSNSTPSPNFYTSENISQRPTSSQSSYSEPIHNIRIPKRRESCCTSYSEPAVPNKMVKNYNMKAPVTYPPVLQYIPHTMPLETTNPPVLHIPDLNYNNPVDNTQSVKILSDQIIVTPARDYLENFINSLE